MPGSLLPFPEPSGLTILRGVVWLGAAAALLLGAAPASALSLSSQTRTAGARGEIVVGGIPVVDAQAEAAPDFAVFFAEPTATAASGPHLGAADAFQDSQLALATGTLEVEAGGAALGFFDTAGLVLSDSAEGEASALFELNFEVTAQTSWLLAGVLGSELEYLDLELPGSAATVTAGAWIELVGAGSGLVFRQEVADLLANFQPVQEDVLAGGMLAADSYTLRGFASAFAAGTGGAEGSGISAFALRFEATEVPEPGTGLFVAAGIALLVVGERRRIARRAGKG
jgi:hypothetical protein